MTSPTRSVPLGQPTVGQPELDAVAAVFDSGWLSGAGPACVAFEAEFAAAVGARHALATSNCGSALHLGLQVLGAGPGQEVIVGDYTFPATGHAVLWTGATPVFADVRADTFAIDPDRIADLITDRTVGIIAVDPFGQPADYDELNTLAAEHGLWVLEDAACAAGATYRGKPAGALTDLAAFSFHGRKGITAGEGGALVGDDEERLSLARKLHTYGIAPAVTREGAATLPVPEFDLAGYNYRMSDVQAGIMRVQLQRLPDLLAARSRAAQAYAVGLGALEQLTLPVVAEGRTHAWQSYVIGIDPALDRGRVALELRARGVGCNFGTYASHRQPVYDAPAACPVSADLFDRHLAIPMHANLTEDDLGYVIDVLTEVVATDAVRA